MAIYLPPPQPPKRPPGSIPPLRGILEAILGGFFGGSTPINIIPQRERGQPLGSLRNDPTFTGGPLYSAAPLPAPSPGPATGTGGSVLDELLRRPGNIGTGGSILDDLLKRPRTSVPTSGPLDELLRMPRNTTVLAGVESAATILARASGLLSVLYPRTAGRGSDVPKEELERRAREQRPGRKGPRARRGPRQPRVPQPPSPVLPGTSPDRTVPSSEPRTPRSEPRLDLPTIEVPEIQPSALPRPRSVPLPTAGTLRTALPAVLGLGLPFALPSLLPSSSPRNRGVTLSPLQPGRTIDSLNRFPEPIGLTRFQPGALASPLPRSSSSGDNCQCTKPTKPRKPRKPRTVCYRGTYVETARGTSKFKREKIPCRSS